MPLPVELSNDDRRIWEEELADWLPSRIFDAHIHLFDSSHLRPGPPTAFHEWSPAALADLRQWSELLYPGREVHYLALGTPAPTIDVEAHNQWALEQIVGDTRSRYHRLVTPECRLDDIRRDLAHPQCIGLKPYRFFSVTGDPHQCRIGDFLPVEQIELADELSASVTLHLSRFDGCADRHNLEDLAQYTSRFPRVRWILAHCARSFTWWAIREAVSVLRELPNLWYDVSAVTDIRPLITLLRDEDPQRILYGSDGVDANFFRGKYVAFGRSWQGVDFRRLDLAFPHCDARPILSIYEQLLAMKQASEIVGWSRQQIEHMFWDNAQTMLER